MALLKAGYWQTTYYPSQYWQEDYWPEYGTATPPTPVVYPSISPPKRRIHKHKLHPIYHVIKDYLEMKVKQHDTTS